MKALVLLAALVILACAPAPPTGSPGACSADNLGDLVGREADVALNEQALRRSGARQSRRIRPGDAVTMDYREDRLNIHVDARGRVERFACG